MPYMVTFVAEAPGKEFVVDVRDKSDTNAVREPPGFLQ
jgi:hypothetical protein